MPAGELRLGSTTITSMLTVGIQGPYEWLVTDQQFDLLQICPDVVLGKYVAITSLDSGPLVSTDEEKAAGWENRGNIAYSPKVQDVGSLPRADYDEWYTFSDPSDLGTGHIGENIFEVPQGQGTRQRVCELWLRLAPTRESQQAPRFLLATTRTN
jgi:hypothetical protein